MKRETRLAILSGSKVNTFKVFLITVFRGNLIDGICLDILSNVDEFVNFIKNCKYLGEIRLIIYLLDSNRINKDEQIIGHIDKIIPQYIVMSDEGEILKVKNVKSRIIKMIYMRMSIHEKIRLHRSILTEIVNIFRGEINGRE